MLRSGIAILILTMFMTGFFILSCAPRANEFSLYDTATGERISISKMATRLSEYDIVVFGEYHGNEIIHKIQADLLPYYLKHAQEIAISMEMFERDTQIALDAYLDNIMDEEDFITQARAWPNYATDYKPLIEFARQENLPVIAANVPRRYAAEVNRNGLVYLDELPEEERGYLAEEIVITEDDYQDKFLETMMMTSHLSTMDKELLEERLFNLYAAQSLKDDTMAESIIQHKIKEPDVKIIHFTGDFHSRGRLGMVTKIQLLNPHLKVATISPYVLNDFSKFEFQEDFSNIADFVIVLHEQNKNE